MLTDWIAPVLLLSLRVAPVFAFAPPFSLIRTPLSFRVLFSLGVSACIVSANPAAAAVGSLAAGHLIVIAMRELLLGTVFLVAFQLCFAALQLAGRTLDIQAGFGLATLIDPGTQASVPLIGTLFVYAGGAVFYGLDGHVDLLRFLVASLDAVPVGGYAPQGVPLGLLSFVSAIFVVGLGVGGAATLALFLADLAIALLSRTVPQMNVLLLGFQVKTIALLLVMPLVFGGAGVVLARMMRLTIQSLAGLT